MSSLEQLPLYRRALRLPAPSYREAGDPVLVTFCARERGSDVLTRGALATVISEVIRAGAESGGVEVHVWCVMPDHVHVVVRPAGDDVVAWVGRVKGRVAARARSLGIRSLWQRSFHDRVLWRKEDLVPAVRYVLNNPVRAGLVGSWQEWAHSGSLVWDLSGWPEV